MAKYQAREPIIVPTFDRRHMPFIREGKISAEVFTKSHERRQELNLPVITSEEDGI